MTRAKRLALAQRRPRRMPGISIELLKRGKLRNLGVENNLGALGPQ